MSVPSRFETTLNLACAAMTVLFCGSLTAEQQASLAESSVDLQIRPLRWEFDDVFSAHPHFTGTFFPIVCADLAPWRYSQFNAAYNRLRLLLDIAARPSTVIDAFASRTGLRRGQRIVWRHYRLEAIEVAGKLKIEIKNVAACWNATVDLDALWLKCRQKLQEMRADLHGGCK